MLNPMSNPFPAENERIPSIPMRYSSTSRRSFPQDRHDEFRDYMLYHRNETLSHWVGEIATIYLRAARLLAAKDDPIAICLEDEVFDARTLWVVHDHLAAHWRAKFLEKNLTEGPAFVIGRTGNEVFRASYSGLIGMFRFWVLNNTRHWSVKTPDLVRLICRVIVGEHGATGQTFEMALFDAFAHLFPVPGIQPLTASFPPFRTWL
jgi:hypothetical protein